MRDANTLAATSTQLAGGLAIAVATVALRIGGAFGAGLTAYTVAFCLLALIAAGPPPGRCAWTRAPVTPRAASALPPPCRRRPAASRAASRAALNQLPREGQGQGDPQIASYGLLPVYILSDR